VHVADLKDPLAGTPAIAICVYDASSTPQPLLDGTILPGGACGAKPCWKALGGPGGYRYRNRAATPDGVTDLKLRVNGAGELQLVAKGRGANLKLPALRLATPVRVQLVVSDGAGTECWESTFSNAIRNDAGTFKANGS